MYRSARNRAKQLGLPFDLTKEFLQNLFERCPPTCPVLKIPMRVGNPNVWNVPSLDRIHPQLGYVIGNVRLISHRANSIKYDATVEELRLVYEDAVLLTTPKVDP
jgi:hypothetical protein